MAAFLPSVHVVKLKLRMKIEQVDSLNPSVKGKIGRLVDPNTSIT